MNIIENQRETIIRENNTAQTELIGMMENMSKSIRELSIQEILHGDLDFAYLGERGFTHVETIELGEGEITSIKNLPESVRSLSCSRNLLTTLEGLPRDLETLICENNYLARFNGETTQKLKVLQLSDNKLVEMENLPKDLEELYVDNNQLRVLNLEDCPSLRTLHASNNPMLIIEHVPESLVDLQCENSPFVNTTSSVDAGEPTTHEENVSKIDYLESLRDYFKLKTKYENALHDTRKKAYKEAATKAIGRKLLKQIKPKCVNCRRPVGTIFELKDERYMAMCGDPNRATKCNLHIELYRGGFTYEEYLVYLFKEQVETLKESIVKQKLDVLFSYKSETAVAQKFKKEIEDYNTDSSMYKTLITNHDELYYSTERREKMVEKLEKIEQLKTSMQHMMDEYGNTNNAKLLHDAVSIQIHQLQPEIENLRRLKYDIMEMDNAISMGGNPMEPKEVVLCNLIQRTVALSETEYTFGEPSRVVKYSAKK
jgi:hypothetical protein